MMKQSNVIILPSSSWLITLGNGAILDTLCWFLLLADWAPPAAIARVALVSGCPHCCAHVSLHPCYHGHPS